jgi:imidazolonepropionase-like amidohydrolase
VVVFLAAKLTEVIERATRRPAKFLGISDQTGTVEQGKIADLVLLDANPLDDIRNTKKIWALILRGTVYDQNGIKRILANVRAAPDIRVDDWGRTSSVRTP